MIELNKVFKNNEVDDALVSLVNFANSQIKKSDGIIEGKLKVNGNPKITVVAKETISGKHSEEVILNFGISRCSSTDKFDKEKGLKIANWRAEHDAVLRLAVPNKISFSDLIILFNRNASFLNNIFRSSKKNYVLRKCPDELLKAPKSAVVV